MRTARAIILLPPALLAAAAFGVALAGDEPCDRLMAELRTLASGSFEEKWALLEDGVPELDTFVGDPAGTFPECHVEAKEKLLRILHGEADDRILVQLLVDIGSEFDDDDPKLVAYELGALEHRSPNVRREVAGLLGESSDERVAPKLRSLWRTETRPWVRAAVAIALAGVDDHTLVDELDAELDSADGLLADDLLAAVVELADSRSLPAIERIAGGPAGERRKRAISGLVDWTDDPAASDALDRLALSSDSAISSEVIQALARGRERPIDALQRVRAKAAADGDAAAAEAADAAIERCSDAIEHPEAGASPGALPPSASSSRYTPLDVFDERSGDDDHLIVRPAAGSATARCWRFPGFIDRNRLTQRIPGGAKVMSYEVFEWNGELWEEISGEPNECWMPESSLVADPDKGRGAPADPAKDLEIDLFRDDLSAKSFRILENAGFARTFDEADEVVGVRLGAPAGEPPPIELILDAWNDTVPELDRGLRIWLVMHADLWVEHPSIMTRLGEGSGE